MPQSTVFISYSQEDEAEKDALVAQLSVLQHAGLVDVWSDTRIAAGSDVQQAVDNAIAQAKVAILLISANFFSSEILDQELPRLLERHRGKDLVIFPVIAKACSWEVVPWLANLSVRPRNRQPVWREGGRYADEELSKIATEVAGIVRGAGNDTSQSENTEAADDQSATQKASPVTSSSGETQETLTNIKQKRNWDKIGAIAGVIGVIVAIIALLVSPDLRGLIFSSATPTTEPSASFSYQVRVQDKETGESISNAVVTIEVGGKAPLDGITDSNGLARIFVSASHAGQPGRLIVEAAGYKRHTQNIDLTEGALPDVVLLESEP